MDQDSRKGLGRTWLPLVALTLLAPSWALAQRPTIPVAEAPTPADAAALPVAAATEKPAEELEELDEVVVVGGRLYERIVRAEDKFFKAYNALNKEDDFDTNCANVITDADSRIESRFCMPAFFADAKAEQARLGEYCRSLRQEETDADGNVNVSQGVCYEPPSAEILFSHRRDEYIDNMLKVVNDDPDLRKMAQDVENLHRERAAYEHRFDELRAQQVADRAGRSRNRTTVR
jgi:hypothetical protein